jgi:hypothetical protein
MAKNWKPFEGIKAVQEGDKAEVMDLGKRFPLFARLAANGDLLGIIEALPEDVTVRKIEAMLKKGVVELEDAEETEVEEKEEKKKKNKKKDKKEKKKGKKGKSKKKEVEEEEEDDEDLEDLELDDDEDDDEDEDDDWDI